jgi:hypothetical protein
MLLCLVLFVYDAGEAHTCACARAVCAYTPSGLVPPCSALTCTLTLCASMLAQVAWQDSDFTGQYRWGYSGAYDLLRVGESERSQRAVIVPGDSLTISVAMAPPQSDTISSPTRKASGAAAAAASSPSPAAAASNSFKGAMQVGLVSILHKSQQYVFAWC